MSNQRKPACGQPAGRKGGSDAAILNRGREAPPGLGDGIAKALSDAHRPPDFVHLSKGAGGRDDSSNGPRT
jgi:hypothetical protein